MFLQLQLKNKLLHLVSNNQWFAFGITYGCLWCWYWLPITTRKIYDLEKYWL